MTSSFFDNITKGVVPTTDVLSCLANLSNDEVFTPPVIVNQMLDLLPQELFSDPNTRFLDPACKTGVFLREIAKRLIVGLKPIYPDLQERVDHILHEQVFGIAITELTSLLSRRSLYCSKYPNSRYSISKFDNVEGNIRFKRLNHKWGENGKCICCGAPMDKYLRNNSFENYAYEWIHNEKYKEIFNMKFDVIIGNPPYQLTIGKESEKYAIPIYQKFINQSKQLNPRYLVMIIPAKWYTSGRGLDEFRNEMLNDGHIRKMVDFPNPYDCFQGVDNPGGICYFLWDRDHEGLCEFTTSIGDKKHSVIRQLNKYDVFVRDATGVDIIEKVSQNSNTAKRLSDVVSPQTPFGIISSYKPVEEGVPCWFKQRMGKLFVEKKDIRDNNGYLNKYKLLIPKAPIAGQTDFTKPVGLYYIGNTRIAAPGECCTQSWLVANTFDTLEETEFFRSYLLTKVVRFLILQAVMSQDVSREKFCFVPDLEKYDRYYSDEYLCNIWNINDDEWQYIDSRVHNYGGGD